jgi:integrase/recombinase XerD
MNTAIALLPSFEAYSKRIGRKDSTIGLYRDNLKSFSEWAGDRPVNEFEPLDMEKFFDQWVADFIERNGSDPAANTLRKLWQSLNLFFKWATDYDYCDKNPMRRMEPPKVERRANDWLRPDEDALVLGACQTYNERLAVYVLRFAGLRSSEAVNLRWSDITFEGGQIWLHVRESKTARGRRTIPVAAELRPLLTRPLPLNQADNWVFATKTGKPWHRNQLRTTVARVGDRVGIRLYPHRLRKTLGSSIFNNGAELSSVSRILGHANTQITEQAYAELTPEKVAQDFLKAVDFR